jgi:GntR family transcriptional regulator/MocR family aminotransferase
MLFTIVGVGDERGKVQSREKACGHLPASGGMKSEWYHRASLMLPNVNSHMPRVTAGLLVRIDGRSGVGLQQQIYAAVRRGILSNVIKPGTRLPSSRALAGDLCVSRTTTLLAYEQLTAEGYLTTRYGSGTFVADEIPDDLARTTAVRRPPATKHPPLSRRGTAMAAMPSAWRRLPGASRAFRAGVPGLDLFPMRLWSQLVNRRLRSITIGQLDCSDAAGFSELRAAVAEHVQVARGTRVGADQVIIVAGAQRAFDLVCHLLLDPGDKAWLEEPGYPGARSALAGAGAQIVPVRVDEHGLDVDAGVRRAPDARLAYVTPSHQFPLGVPMTLARRLALLKWATIAGAWVVEDDYDSEFRYGTRAIPCLHGLDVDGRVIYIGSFSKTLFPALRLGFMIVPSDLRDRILSVRRATDIHPQLLDQAVLADFIAGGHFERHLRRMRTAYRERLEALAAAATRHCGGVLQIRPVTTGLHAVADLSGADAVPVSEEAYARGVEVAPMQRYCVTPSRAANALVLGFAAVRPDGFRNGMERLAAAIDAAGRGQPRGTVRRTSAGAR